MRVVRRLNRLLANLLRWQQAEDSLDAEIRSYVEEQARRLVASGMPVGDARRQALMETGGVECIKEGVRDVWLGRAIRTTAEDVRFACRCLLRSRGFAAIVIATMALGMGAALTMFSLMRAVMWRPLPYPEPDRIVTIQVDARSVSNAGAALGEVLDLKERGRSFEQVAMLDAGTATLTSEGEPERVTHARVSDDFLPLLGARLTLGRLLDSRLDDAKAGPSAILISGELWRRRFSSDPGVIGRTVRVDDQDVRIAGVLAPHFRLFLPTAASGAEQIDIWIPFAMKPIRQYRGIPILARLRPGTTLSEANAELQTLASKFQQEHPGFYAGTKGWQASPFDRDLSNRLRFIAQPLQEAVTRDARPTLILLTGVVGFVLLLACANVANLMLSRNTVRQREFEIRRALGAGRIRIARQLLTESLLIALASSCVGLLLARFALQAITSASASHLPLHSRIATDVEVAMFAVALAVVTSLLFGMLPAWHTASSRSQPASRTQTTGTNLRNLQRALVAMEVALSIVPLACGGLMLRSLMNLLDAPLGFDPAHVVTAQAPFSLSLYPKAEQQWAVMREVIDRVSAIPGVQAVSAASPLPLFPNQQKRRVGRVDRLDDPPILATQQGAMPGYLGVAGTPLRAGRDFTDDDVTARRSVAIVDERLAKRLWPEGALGKRLAVYRTGRRDDLEVIGVTAAVRATRVRDDDIPGFLLPSIETSLVIKTRETSDRLAPSIRSAVEAAHTGRGAFDIRPMSAYVSDSIGDTRFVLFVLAAFAWVSLLLAAVGLYATLAYLTAQRAKEFGIRMALGSSVKAIVTIVVRESVLLAVGGLVLGLLCAVAVTLAIRELLYGVDPLDQTTLVGVVSIVGFVALIAAIVPAWRAATIDPQRALRSE
ncbi:MAG: ABC transporter permease [Bryobacterales bacterium]|nr:ABC transporter permease [Bryobacterales bacterium]